MHNQRNFRKFMKHKRKDLVRDPEVRFALLFGYTGAFDRSEPLGSVKQL